MFPISTKTLTAGRPFCVLLVLLCAFLVGGQVAQLAHSDDDCEHDSCNLCMPLSGEGEISCEPAGTAVRGSIHGVDLSDCADGCLAIWAPSPLIRAPPIN